MIIKYNIDLKNETIENSLKKIINQIYRLLPSREEHSDWESPLTTIIIELSGMKRILQINEELFFNLICKLEGLFMLKEEEDFYLYRKTIFECLSLCDSLKRGINNEELG